MWSSKFGNHYFFLKINKACLLEALSNPTIDICSTSSDPAFLEVIQPWSPFPANSGDNALPLLVCLLHNSFTLVFYPPPTSAHLPALQCGRGLLGPLWVELYLGFLANFLPSKSCECKVVTSAAEVLPNFQAEAGNCKPSAAGFTTSPLALPHSCVN